MVKCLEKIGRVFTWLVFAWLAICVLSFAQSRLSGSDVTYIAGYRIHYILSGSMEPTIRTDSLVIGKKVNSLSDLRVGDIVCYRAFDTRRQETIEVIHRIISIDDNGIITTQGDHNEAADVFRLEIGNIKDKVIFTANWTASDAFKYSAAFILVLGVVLSDFDKTRNQKTKSQYGSKSSA